MKRTREIRKNGYICFIRFWIWAVKSKVINTSLLGAFIIFVSLADWEERHSTYGYIIQTDEEIAKFLNTSHSTINKQRKKLIKVGLLEKTDIGTRVKHYQLFKQKYIRHLHGGLYDWNNSSENFLELLEDIITNLENIKSFEAGNV